MTRNVVKLPTAAESYYTVTKAKGGWAVQLVTPIPGRAIEEGRQAAARMQRPFKARGPR